jgi:hypothetical protein
MVPSRGRDFFLLGLEQRHVEVAAIGPHVSGLEGDGGDETQGTVAIREGTDAPGAPLDLTVEPLEAVG